MNKSGVKRLPQGLNLGALTPPPAGFFKEYHELCAGLQQCGVDLMLRNPRVPQGLSLHYALSSASLAFVRGLRAQGHYRWGGWGRGGHGWCRLFMWGFRGTGPLQVCV